MKMIAKGDKVTVLDDNISGIVLEVKGNAVRIETPDGFELEYDKSELIKMGNELRKSTIQNIAQVIREKQQPEKRSFVKQKKTDSKEIAFDLHIEKLVRSTKGLQPYDMLELQLDTAKRHIEFAIAKRIPKIVLIHGVGDGKLKAEIEFMLKRYDNVWFQEASFQRYGQGAIEVNFKQNS
ncbi:MAG: Smr/MutS family protein [Flavobacteriaceae bacterium]